MGIYLGRRAAAGSSSAVNRHGDLDFVVVLVRVAVADEYGVCLAAWLDGGGFELVDVVYCRGVGHFVFGDRPSGDLMDRCESRESGKGKLQSSGY